MFWTNKMRICEWNQESARGSVIVKKLRRPRACVAMNIYERWQKFIKLPHKLILDLKIICVESKSSRGSFFYTPSGEVFTSLKFIRVHLHYTPGKFPLGRPLVILSEGRTQREKQCNAHNWIPKTHESSINLCVRFSIFSLLAKAKSHFPFCPCALALGPRDEEKSEWVPVCTYIELWGWCPWGRAVPLHCWPCTDTRRPGVSRPAQWLSRSPPPTFHRMATCCSETQNLHNFIWHSNLIFIWHWDGK